MLATLSRFAGLFTGRDRESWPVAVLGLVALAFVAGHVLQVSLYFLPAGQFKIMHVGGAVLIIMLSIAARNAGTVSRWLHLALALLTVAVIGYVFAEYRALTGARSFLPNETDMAVALVLLALALYASMREWGWLVSLIAVVGILYGYFGYLLPDGLLAHGGLTLRRLIGYTSIPYFSGLLGSLAELSAGTIFPFMLLAAALQVTGCVTFIMDVAYRIGGGTRAGPAQIAVISSGFMGMVSGSSVANVASTGALTIPLMKRVGFKPEFAGAVESVASTGGQVTPPVMGLAAFLIVGMTGIPYSEIILAAAFPALIYYAYLMFAVHLRAVKYGLDAANDPTIAQEFAGRHSLGRACLEHIHFFAAIGYLVSVLIITNLPGRTAVEATGVLLALFAAKQLLFVWRGVSERIMGLARMLCETAYSGALRGAQVAIVVAVIGVLVEVLTITGFAQKLSFAMLEFAGGSLWPLLFVAALACLAFGLGLPTSASYILVALLGAPALVNLGVPIIAAHFFVFYFANVSAITPPVAVSCLVASKIADGRFFPTSFIAVRLGLPGFVLPFLFVMHPEILGVDASLAMTALVATMAFLGVLALNVILEGFLFRPLSWIERILLLPAAGGLLHPSLLASTVGIGLFAAIAAVQWRARGTQRAQSGSTPDSVTVAKPPSAGGSR